MLTDPAAVAATAFALRIAERVALSLVVVVVALTVTLGFWRSIQRVDFDLGDKPGGSARLVLATPVFALLALIGFAWVSFSNPITVTVPGQGTTAGAETAAATTSMMGATPASPEAGIEFRRGEAIGAIRSLNCALRGREGLSPREIDALARIRLSLMRPVWDTAWGDPEAFGAWALGLRTDPPDPDARAVYEAVHPLC